MIVVLILLTMGAVMVFVRCILSNQEEWESRHHARMQAMDASLRDDDRHRADLANMGPLDLYLSSGRIPTGRTFEILAEAQRSHDEHSRRRT